jgi:hypothetical protein
MAAPSFLVLSNACPMPVKRANSRFARGAAPAGGFALQTRKAESAALHDGCLMPAAIAQRMRGDSRFAPEDSTLIDRVIGPLRPRARAR